MVLGCIPVLLRLQRYTSLTVYDLPILLHKCRHGKREECLQILPDNLASSEEPKCFSIDRIKCLDEVEENSIKVTVLLLAFLLELTSYKDTVCCATIRSEACLRFGEI